MEIYRPKTL